MSAVSYRIALLRWTISYKLAKLWFLIKNIKITTKYMGPNERAMFELLKPKSFNPMALQIYDLAPKGYHYVQTDVGTIYVRKHDNLDSTLPAIIYPTKNKI